MESRRAGETGVIRSETQLYFRLIVSQGLDVYSIQEAARDRTRVPAPLPPSLWKPALASLVMVVVVIGTAGLGIVVRIGIRILTYAAASAMLLTFQGAPGATKNAVPSGGEAPRD